MVGKNEQSFWAVIRRSAPSPAVHQSRDRRVNVAMQTIR
jgi:hypothetical protein